MCKWWTGPHWCSFPTSLSPSSRPNDLDPWSGAKPERTAHVLLLILGSAPRDLFFRLSSRWRLVRRNFLPLSASSSSGSDWTSRYSSLWRTAVGRLGLLKPRRDAFGELTGLVTGEPKGLRDCRRWTKLPNILTHQFVQHLSATAEARKLSYYLTTHSKLMWFSIIMFQEQHKALAVFCGS
jgi:hypothetical protein